MKRVRIVPFLMAISLLGALAPIGRGQSAAGEGSSSNNIASPFSSTSHVHIQLTYVRPTEKAKIRNYLFDTLGPYPIAGAVILGAINQAEKTPPEWGQGFKAYGERVGSDFGIAMATTTTRYALAEAFREDTLYYRCECPYAGTTTAIYGWYPGRYDVKDGLRMGNYALLAFVGANIAREFIYGGPHTLLSQLDRAGSLGADTTESTSNH
jgi:hypothetical protein